MGCISSKSILPSLSIRENPTTTTHAPAAPLTWEELMASHCGNDKLFSIVCSTTKFTTFTPHTPETTAKTQPHPPRFNRSKSFQAATVNDDVAQNKIDLRDKNLAGSRSFHTVEEYDALLNRIHNAIDHHPQSNSVADVEVETDDDIVAETGWKRKAVAKCLKSLDVEFPGIARFRQPRYQYHQGQGHIYSPGTYVTPKFGSYNDKAVPPADDAVFSPELVAAFEDRMQQLKEDEDDILSRMDQYDDVMEKNK